MCRIAATICWNMVSTSLSLFPLPPTSPPRHTHTHTHSSPVKNVVLVDVSNGGHDLLEHGQHLPLPLSPPSHLTSPSHTHIHFTCEGCCVGGCVEWLPRSAGTWSAPPSPCPPPAPGPAWTSTGPVFCEYNRPATPQSQGQVL